MAKFNFASFNKERLFDVDTSGFDYVNLEDLYSRDGGDTVYRVKGVYIGTKSQYDDETPLIAIDDCYVNLPQHQLPDIKNMLANKTAIAGINEGELGFVIDSYYQKRFKKTCYAARWGNYNDLLTEVGEE